MLSHVEIPGDGLLGGVELSYSMVYKMLRGVTRRGVEPPTLWLRATRSNQLSYSNLFLVLNVFQHLTLCYLKL